MLLETKDPIGPSLMMASSGSKRFAVYGLSGKPRCDQFLANSGSELRSDQLRKGCLWNQAAAENTQLHLVLLDNIGLIQQSAAALLAINERHLIELLYPNWFRSVECQRYNICNCPTRDRQMLDVRRHAVAFLPTQGDSRRDVHADESTLLNDRRPRFPLAGSEYANETAPQR